MRISDWSSDVCSSDLVCRVLQPGQCGFRQLAFLIDRGVPDGWPAPAIDPRGSSIIFARRQRQAKPAQARHDTRTQTGRALAAAAGKDDMVDSGDSPCQVTDGLLDTGREEPHGKLRQPSGIGKPTTLVKQTNQTNTD